MLKRYQLCQLGIKSHLRATIGTGGHGLQRKHPRGFGQSPSIDEGAAEPSQEPCNEGLIVGQKRRLPLPQHQSVSKHHSSFRRSGATLL